MLTFTLDRGEFEDGKGKCPYDPAKGHTGLLVGEWLPPVQTGQLWAPLSHAAVLVCTVHSLRVFLLSSGLFDTLYPRLSPVDGELYSATLNNFLGTEPVILRNMGPHHSIKTEYLVFWLNGESWSGTGEAKSARAFWGPGTLPLTLLLCPRTPLCRLRLCPRERGQLHGR